MSTNTPGRAIAVSFVAMLLSLLAIVRGQPAAAAMDAHSRAYSVLGTLPNALGDAHSRAYSFLLQTTSRLDASSRAMSVLLQPPSQLDAHSRAVSVYGGVGLHLDPRATYLRTNEPANCNVDAVATALTSFGVQPGDWVRIQRAGAFSYTTGGPQNGVGTILVFSSSSTLLAPTELARVPGAIAAGTPYVTAPTHNGDLPTDIPEDFAVVDYVDVQVPAGAAYLFAAANDEFYCDNEDPDGDYGIIVTPLSAITDVPRSQDTSKLPLRLAASPNPFAQSVEFSVDLARDNALTLDVFDLQGARVTRLADGSALAGRHLYRWSGIDSSGRRRGAGVYWVVAQIPGHRSTTRVVLIR